MLVIKTKQYEVEEVVQAIDENENVLYEFTMQITPDELKKIEEILIHKDGIKASKELEKLSKQEGNEELIEAKEQELEDMLVKTSEQFEKIVFKGHKDQFIEKAGEYKYAEMLGLMFDFFWKAFIEKRRKQVNTIHSDLAKITSK